MNRIFKFRVWAIEGKFWVKVYDFVVGKNGIYPSGVSPESIIIQQFTGILDKNDCEIYEGDIVNFKEYDKKSERGEFEDSEGYEWKNVVVFWDGLGFKFKLNQYRKNETIKYKWVEIIGNIFENPELLNE